MALADQVSSGWKLDESSGDAVDVKGVNTLANMSVSYANTAPAIIGNYAVFSDAKLSKAGIFGFAVGATVSISFWVYFSGTTSQCIIGRRTGAGGGWSVVLENSTTFRWAVADTVGDKLITGTGVTFSTNTWYHIVLTTTSLGTATSSKIYVNTTELSLAQTVNDSVTPNYAGIAFNIGRWDDDTKKLGGRVDEVYIFDSYDCTSSDVAVLYNGGAGSQYPFAGAGPAHLKKISGVAIANVKKISGVAIANVKVVAGVT